MLLLGFTGRERAGQRGPQGGAGHRRRARRRACGPDLWPASGTRAASARPICATRCGRWATPSTRWRRPPLGQRIPALVEAIEAALRDRPGRRLASGCTSLPICRTSTPTAPASTPPTSSAWRPIPDETLRRWQALKDAASQAIVAHGGTISHQHGVGTDHLPYLAAEKGALGMAAAATICAARFDPAGRDESGQAASGH